MKEIAFSIFGDTVPVPNDLKPISQMNDPLGSLMRFGINFMLIIAIVLTIIFLILSGIQWVTSGGSKEGIQKARARIIYSIVGLIVVLFAFFIVNIVGGLFHTNLTR